MSTLSDMSLNYRSQYIKHSEISINVFEFALCSLESCFFCVRLSPAFLAAEWGLTTPHRTDGDLTKSEESDRTGISCEPRSSSLEFISSNNKGTPPLLFGSRRMISIDQDSSSNNSGDIEWISTRKPDTRSPMILKSGHWTRGLLWDLESNLYRQDLSWRLERRSNLIDFLSNHRAFSISQATKPPESGLS